MEEIPGIDPGKYESALTKLKGCGVMAKSFSSGCLLLVCGTPGCGKTLLTKNLVDEGSKARPGWRWIPIHFDDFYPPDKRTKQGMETQVTFDLKHERAGIRKLLEVLLSQNVDECGPKVTSPSAHTLDNTEPFMRFICYLNSQQNLFDDNGRYASGSEKLVFVLDDNMHLRSMRHEYFLMARKYSLGFAQVVLTCSATTALARNSRRPVPIPDSSVLAMDKNMEFPKPTQHHWESRHMVIQNDEDDRSSLIQECERVVELVEEAIHNPVPPLPEVDVELLSACQAANLENCVHQADNLLRRLVGSAIQGAPPGVQKPAVAREANDTRKKLLEDVRCGVVRSAGETWDASSYEDLDHLRKVIADAFQDSMAVYFNHCS